MILHSVVERNLKINYQQKLEHPKYLAYYYETRIYSILEGLILSSAGIEIQNRHLTQSRLQNFSMAVNLLNMLYT